jgi:1-acyl-sn-glycerol-3-phosphate acyltransferase
VYYRVRHDGADVTPSGPVLLLANHPNTLLDPALVLATARRPVRFLAKATLFEDRWLGWFVRAAGAIPVFRRQDDPSRMDANREVFAAVEDALAAGAAIGIFPEGISHNEPHLAPLRTGAARIALGAARRVGAPLPIVPVGIVLRRRERFRSEALTLVGSPVDWDDLARRRPDDAEAVRELTARLAAALASVTVNVERWEDQPLLDGAVRIWEAERGAPSGPADRVRRVDAAARLLAESRRAADPAALQLVSQLRAHLARLDRLGLRPADLVADVTLPRGVRWAIEGGRWLLLPASLLALASFLLFWTPRRVTGWVVDRLAPQAEERSSYNLLGGTLFYAAWLILLAATIGSIAGIAAGVATLVALPAIGIGGLVIRERWRGAWSDARRFFLLRSRRDLAGALRDRQTDLAARIEAIVVGSSTARGDQAP